MSSSNNNINNPSNPTHPDQPTLLSSHTQYAKGYAEETIGNLTGSKEWQESGKKDAKEGIEGMKVRTSIHPSNPVQASILFDFGI